MNEDFRSKHADAPRREVVWNERRIAIVTAMRQLKAVGPGSAKTAGEIAEAAGVSEVKYVKWALDVYKLNELTHNGYTRSVRLGGMKENVYYLTALGRKVKMVPPAAKDGKGGDE